MAQYVKIWRRLSNDSDRWYERSKCAVRCHVNSMVRRLRNRDNVKNLYYSFAFFWFSFVFFVVVFRFSVFVFCFLFFRHHIQEHLDTSERIIFHINGAQIHGKGVDHGLVSVASNCFSTILNTLWWTMWRWVDLKCRSYCVTRNGESFSKNFKPSNANVSNFSISRSFSNLTKKNGLSQLKKGYW